MCIVFISCTDTKRKLHPPIRLKGIPNNAFWVGGIDGGNWYLVEYVHAHKNNAYIKVYNDSDGSLIVSKRFFLICVLSGQPMFIENLQEQITGFDGEKIYLKRMPGKDSCYLQ